MNDPWVQALGRGRWLESLLAVGGAVAVSWPLGDLVAHRPWTAPLVGLLLLVVVVGSALRTARAPRPLVLVAQVLALLSGLSWWAPAQWPADEPVLVTFAALTGEGVHTIQTYAVPAPATTGLTFVVLAGTALLGLLVEAVGVTYRAAALAGIPLLLVSAATASNTGRPLAPAYFLIGGAAWLALLARQGRSVIEDWRAAGASAASTTVDDTVATRGTHRHLGLTARVMGVAALLLGVVVPGLLPHLPPTALLEGAGRGTGTVSFTDTLDLSRDLGNRSTAPVIRFRTDDPSPPPLRVTVSTEYANGRWFPSREFDGWPATDDGRLMSLNQALVEQHGLEHMTSTLTVTQNGLRAPQLALPHPTTEVDLGDIGWEFVPLDDTLAVEAAPRTYTATYLEIAPLATLPDEVGAAPEPLLRRHPVETVERTPDGTLVKLAEDGTPLEVVHPGGRHERLLTDGSAEVTEPDGTVRRVVGSPDRDPLAVDPASEDRVRELAAQLTGDLTNQVDIALAFQRYLRGPEFTYSLTLADPVVGPDGQTLDPISHFLETKQGYCTQYATAMVMLARASGIPARLAVGFLPGSRGVDGTHTVVAADAHAWPELLITGLGWTRFEPTPATRSGAAPFFTTTTRPEQPTPQSDPTAGEVTPEPTVPDSAGEQGRREEPGRLERYGQTLGRAALALAVVTALLSLTPLAATWRRWRLRRGRGPAEQVEGEWAVLVTGLADLGIEPPRAATPRGMREFYLRAIEPDAHTLDALTRATDRVESARYAPQTPPPGTMREDVRQVLEWCRQHVPWQRRVRAALLPPSGLAQLHPLRRRAREGAPLP